MTVRRAPRALVRALSLVSLTAPLAAILVAGTAPAASAAASWSWVDPTPAAGAVLTGGSSVGVKISYTSGTRPAVYLVLTLPDGSSSSVPRSGCTVSLTNACSGSTVSTSAAMSTNGVPVANGGWSAKVCSTADCSGTVYLSRTFYSDVPSATAPSGVTAKATNPAPGSTTGTIAVSWTYGGPETDIWGYRLADGNGWTGDVAASDAGCASGGTCQVTRQYDNPAGSTQAYSFTVAALRSGCQADGCSAAGATAAPGPVSDAAPAQLVTPVPPPSPTPGPTTTGGTGAGPTGAPGSTPTQGATSGTSTTTRKKTPFVLPTLNPVVAQRKAFALGFNSFSPSLGIPKLPPLPATTFPETVGAATDSTYQPTLPYKPQPAKSTTSILSAPLSAVTSLDTAQLAKSLAMALVLILAAAHLRMFLKQHGPE